ncbi:hypothetical protein QFZ87_003164 [Bacillus sp. SLBN-46]|uniref:hypothetical protein n=1 Tax=Bacillus sp. SLBN-46 TaxID=3042283 RepID=UPI00286425AB|nr:hypothetical protein [Bacillus sp. SLBN-46]MDR6123567.1 hypothetical protein [Bacillus sp. SLBN-46]
MGIIYGLVGILGLFLIIVYAVSFGIDNSKQIKLLRSELKEIKKELKIFGENHK